MTSATAVGFALIELGTQSDDASRIETSTPASSDHDVDDQACEASRVLEVVER